MEDTPTPVRLILDPDQSGGIATTRLTASAGASLDAFPLTSAATVQWELRPGITPFVAQFVVQTDRLEQWMNQVAGQWVALEFDGRFFRRLRVLQAVPLDPINSVVRIADRRADWRYVKTWRRANFRRKGDKVIARGADVISNPERFLPWSINDTQRRAFTAKELAVDLLANVVAQSDVPVADVPALYRLRAQGAGFNVAEAEGLRDNGVVIDQFETLGDTPADILDRLLGASELTVTVDSTGEVVMYDPTVEVPLPAAKPLDGALRIPDLARMRPRQVRVSFVPEKQVRLKFGPRLTDRRRLRNVVQLPADTLIGGVSTPRSTWVSMTQYLAATGFTDQQVRRSFTTSGKKMLERVAYDAASGVYNPVKEREIAAIIGAYRQTYQIDPQYLDTLVSWSPTTVTIIDETTGARIPSPVYTRYFEIAETYGRWTVAYLANKYGVNYSSFPGEPDAIADTLTDAPFSIAVVDADLGIFNIVSKAITNGLIEKRIVSRLNNVGNAMSSLVSDPALIADGVLDDDHRLEVSVTVVEALPNNRNAFHTEIVNSSEGGLVERLEIPYLGETAKFDEAGRLVNRDIVRAIAESEAESVFESYRDKPVGVLTIAHDVATPLGVRWHARSIQFARSTRGHDSVVLDFGEPPLARNAMNYLPQRVKNFLQRSARVDSPTSSP